MADDRRAQQVDHYAAGARVVEDAVAAAHEAGRLDSTPPGGGWTPRMVVHHLADAETRSVVRLRQLLAEDNPTIEAYDEEQYAKVLRYDRPVDVALSAVVAVRAANLELLRLLDDGDFRRSGTHTESGEYSVETWLTTYAAHAHDHAAQIRSAL
jgi:hypothetical protein